MKALQLEQPQRWRLIEIGEPPPPGPGQALMQVVRVGVCGTDFAGFLGKMPFFSYPRIPGHELGVRVLAVGEGVTHIQPGDRCSVEPYINCGRCYSCRRGHTNCCEHNQTLGVMCDGGLTERIVLPAEKLHPAHRLSFDQCALVETLAIGCHAVDRARIVAGENVLIVGAGPIGLSALVFVTLAGARPIVMDISEPRLRFVRDRMGVADTILASGDESDLRTLAEATGGQWADAVIDATGNHRSMSRALEFAAFAGRVVYVGIAQQAMELPHAPVFHRRELTLLASRNALPGNFKRIIEQIEAGRIDTNPWMTHRARMSEVPAVFSQWLDPAAGVLKPMIEVGHESENR